MDVLLHIKEQLEQAQRIALFGHQSVDGDALGAMYGLGRQLEKL
jgi:nanoRNase/pAp phosphatase (c-di-AMP/oligoRNAs hydrolase)